MLRFTVCFWLSYWLVDAPSLQPHPAAETASHSQHRGGQCPASVQPLWGHPPAPAGLGGLCRGSHLAGGSAWARLDPASGLSCAASALPAAGPPGAAARATAAGSTSGWSMQRRMRLTPSGPVDLGSCSKPNCWLQLPAGGTGNSCRSRRLSCWKCCSAAVSWPADRPLLADSCSAWGRELSSWHELSSSRAISAATRAVNRKSDKLFKAQTEIINQFNLTPLHSDVTLQLFCTLYSTLWRIT